MPKRVLFWDFDGTLIHPNEASLIALRNAVESFHYIIAAEDIRAFLHSVCSWYKPEISYSERVGSKWWDDLFANYNVFYEHHGIAKTDRQNINNIFKAYILNYKNYTLYDDSKGILHYCKAMGYKNYIISNNYPELPSTIESLGLAEYFTDYIVSSNIGFEKPRAEIFQYALRIADYPNLCYMIGDNPVADIQGGINAGMKTILVHNKTIYSTDEDNFMCENLIDIENIIT